MPSRVWFNEGLSNTYDAIRLAREGDGAGELTLFASHKSPHAPVLTSADAVWLEPSGGVSDDDYRDWCLARCAEHQVDLLYAQRRRALLTRERERFEQIGTRVLSVADPEMLELIEKKDAFYRDLEGSSVPMPIFRLARTVDEFDQAYAELRTLGLRVCVKPAAGMFGLGFRVLEEAGDDFARLIAGDAVHIGLVFFRSLLAQSSQQRDLMVMEYLPGHERSVDCVAHQGRLVAAVSRLKRDGYQELETEGESIDTARYLTCRYQLDGQFNLQTRETRGRPYLLEINSRMSGGMLYSCLSGVNLPYWTLMLALGLRTAEDVPAPRAGLRVAPVNAAIVLEDAPGAA